MSNEPGEKKLPSKNLQIILFVVFAVIAIAIAMLVQKPGKIDIPEGQQQGAAPAGGAGGGAPPAGGGAPPPQ